MREQIELSSEEFEWNDVVKLANANLRSESIDSYYRARDLYSVFASQHPEYNARASVEKRKINVLIANRSRV